MPACSAPGPAVGWLATQCWASERLRCAAIPTPARPMSSEPRQSLAIRESPPRMRLPRMRPRRTSPFEMPALPARGQAQAEPRASSGARVNLSCSGPLAIPLSLCRRAAGPAGPRPGRPATLGRRRCPRAAAELPPPCVAAAMPAESVSATSAAASLQRVPKRPAASKSSPAHASTAALASTATAARWTPSPARQTGPAMGRASR